MCQLFNRIEERLAPLKRFSERFLSPLVFLLLRLKLGSVFLVSGWLKFGYVIHDQLDTLYFLFDDYKVPFLPSHVAAWMGMGGELGFGALVTLGLFARLGALGLIFMSAVIYHTDGNQQAIYWALICAAIAVHGAGKLSLDALIWRKKDKPETL